MISQKATGQFHTKSGDTIDVKLFVMLFSDGDSMVAYCPALDVYGYGKDEHEARISFETCLTEFFKYTLNKGTFFIELENLGWSCKKKHKPQPPTLSELISKNSEIAELWNNKEFSKFNTDIKIPAVC